MADKALGSSLGAAFWPEHGDATFDRELDFGVREQTKLFADFLRNRDLALAGDSHGKSITRKNLTTPAPAASTAATAAPRRLLRLRVEPVPAKRSV